MKKGFYYMHMISKDGEARATKTEGYVEGDLGVRRNNDNEKWEVTHIPTGGVIGRGETRKTALAMARHRIENDPSFQERVDSCMKTEGFEQFKFSVWMQTLKTAFQRREK